MEEKISLKHKSFSWRDVGQCKEHEFGLWHWNGITVRKMHMSSFPGEVRVHGILSSCSAWLQWQGIPLGPGSRMIMVVDRGDTPVSFHLLKTRNIHCRQASPLWWSVRVIILVRWWSLQCPKGIKCQWWGEDTLGSPPSERTGASEQPWSTGHRMDALGKSRRPFPAGSVGCEHPQWEGRKRLWETVLLMSWTCLHKRGSRVCDEKLHGLFFKYSTAIYTVFGLGLASGHCCWSCSPERLTLLGRFCLGCYTVDSQGVQLRGYAASPDSTPVTVG